MSTPTLKPTGEHALLLDLQGRLNNLRLPPGKALVPLFEAIINALHAIEQRGEDRGSVTIEVLREGDQREMNLETRPSISGFRIKDDGIGFNDDNVTSFETSDSQFKAKLGCRGVGRFTWLKAFGSVTVDSHFRVDGKIRRRTFRFSPSGVTEWQETPAVASSTGTVITLDNIFPNYQKNIPKRTSTLAQRIVEHCLMAVHSCGVQNLQLTLHDDDDIEDIGKMVSEEFQGADVDEFKLNNKTFRLTHLRVTSAEVKSHRISYLANRREVRDDPLSKDIPQLSQRLNASGSDFWWVSLVESAYLDQQVSSERDAFLFPDSAKDVQKDGDLYDDILTLDKIREQATVLAAKRLEPFLAPLREKATERVRLYTNTRAPEYKPLLRLRPQEIEAIPPDISDDRLDAELHKVKHAVEVELRAEGQALLSSENVDADKYAKFLTEANELGKADLAKYVVHRRTILDLFKRSLERKSDGKFELEEAVHQHIFPLRTTSDEITFEQSNLWMIDERLAYHSYLASDKQFSTIPVVDDTGRERPDIIVFGNPLAFAEDAPYGSIVIVEFKRPQRGDYTDEENPFTQVFSYVRKLRNPDAQDRRGRPINARDSMPIYCYIVCDLTRRLREQAQNANLDPTPDDQGFFGFNKQLRAYVEVISFDKLINDAVKRNRVFFDKLNLPKG